MTDSQPGLIYFSIGFASVYMLLSVWRHVGYSNKKSNSRRSLLKNWSQKHLEDCISSKSLADLARCNNVGLQTSAFRLLLDRAISEPHLEFLIHACRQKNNEEAKLKAITTLQLLSRNEDNKALLVNVGALEVLVEMLSDENKEAIYKHAAVILCDLINANDDRKNKIVAYGVIEPLTKFLQNFNKYSNETKYWSLMLVYHLSFYEEVHPQMIRANFIPLLADLTRKTFGNVNMPKVCLQTLVRIVASMEPSDAIPQLYTLLDYKMDSLISACLRSEDGELIYWAIGLMHEFVVKDVARPMFRQIRGILKLVTNLLSAEETYISKIALRTLRFLALHNEIFQMKIITSGTIKKIVTCLSSEDEDVQYWALALLHEVTSHAQAHSEIIDAGGLPLLLEFDSSTNTIVQLYLVEILAYLCSSVKNHEALVNQPELLDVIYQFLRSSDYDLQYSATAILFNLASMSNTMTQKIIQSPCTNQLMLHILNGDHGKIQRTCAKTLVILANHETSFFQRIFTMIVEPLIEHTIDLGEETILSLEPDLYPIDLNREFFISNELRTDRPLQLRRITLNEIRNTDGFDSRIIIPSALLAERFINFIRTLHIFVEYDRAFEDFISQNKDPQSGELFEGELLKLLRILIDMTSLPLVNSQMPRLIGNQDAPMYKPWEMEGDARNNLSFMVREYFLEESSVTADSQNSLHSSPKSEGVFGLSFDIDGDDVKKTNDMEIDVKTTKVALCNYALNVLVALSKYSIVRNYLIEHDFLKTTLLVQKLCRPALENSIIAISIILSKSQLQKSLKSPSILVNAWRGLFKPSTQTSTIVFYTQMLLSHCSNYSLAACESVGRTRYLGLSRADRTKHLMMLKDNLEVRNELWTFGSVRATRGVQGNGKYAYEVKLNTDGLVQLGWASKLCRFDPEGGSGVGDDIHSYSYDGQRSKKWHGICPVNNQYGDKWSAGDIITSCIDLDHGTIEYYRNGLCLGVAFTNVSSDTIWYPALSLASGQGCRTYFGGKLDPLRFLPKGYKPVASILEIGKIDANTNTEGKLDISLSPGLGSMNVVSVSSNKPSSLFETNHTTSDTIPSYLGQVMLSSASYFTEEPDFISLSEETSPTTQDQLVLPSTPSESEHEVESKIKRASDNDVCKLTESNEIYSESCDDGSTTHHQTLIDEESNHQQTGNSTQADQYYSLSRNAAENERCTPDELPHLTLDDELAENSEMMFSDADLDLPFSRMLRLKGIHPNVDLPEPNFVDAFYFEVCLGLRGLIDGLYPQIGMIDRDDTIYMLIMGPRECCTATIQHSHLDETFFRSIPRDIMEPRSDDDQTVHSDILSFEIINDNNPVTHGDYVGCGYSAEERTVFFTLNGNLLARIPVPNQILLLPYIRYVPRSICNFGQEQFQYQPAYSIVTQMIDV